MVTDDDVVRTNVAIELRLKQKLLILKSVEVARKASVNLFMIYQIDERWNKQRNNNSPAFTTRL